MLDKVVWGNPLDAYLEALGIFASFCALFFLFRRQVLDRLTALAQRSGSRLHTLLVEFIVGSWALDCEAVYAADESHGSWLDAHEAIQLSILDAFRREAIPLAPPRA